MNVVKYGETVWSELYPGNQHTVNCLQPAVKATESSLELAPAQRRRTVWRFDGGAGSDEQFRWLLNRGYHVVGKGTSNFRAGTLAKQVRRWDSYEDYQLGEVAPPVDYGRPVRFFVMRRCKKGQWKHRYYVSSLQFHPKNCSSTPKASEVEPKLSSFDRINKDLPWRLVARLLSMGKKRSFY